MRNKCALRREDELFLTSQESITPHGTTPLLISNIFFSREFEHDLFQIEMTTIEEEIYDCGRNFEMSRISPIPLAIPIFDIDNSQIPILFS